MSRPLCVHCGKNRGCRSGRGLCRLCWDDPAIRAKYPPVAKFGGKDASKLREKALPTTYTIARKWVVLARTGERPPRPVGAHDTEQGAERELRKRLAESVTTATAGEGEPGFGS